MRRKKDDILVRFTRDLAGTQAGDQMLVDEDLLTALEHDGYVMRIREDTTWDIIGEDDGDIDSR